jgi:hypothetical protein
MQTSRPLEVVKKWPTPTVLIVVGGWLMLLSTGWWVVTAYGFKRDIQTTGGPIQSWPDESQLLRVNGLHTMLVFLHPKCPCSQATVAELERLFGAPSRHARTLHLIIVATIPQSAETTWAQTNLIERCMKLQHASLHVDRGGTEANRFRAQVSGTVMLFDSSGALRYAGGVTMSRGHEGDNAGRDALAQILSGEHCSTWIPAFGCQLVLEHDQTAANLSPAPVKARASDAADALTRIVEQPWNGDER